MLHGLYITSDGTPMYTNKYLKTKLYLLEKSTGQPVQFGLGYLGVKGMFKFLRSLLLRPFISTFFGKSAFTTANTALFYHHKRLFALMEAEIPFRFHAPSLDSIGEFNFEGWLDQDERTKQFTAHPKVCPETGLAFFFGTVIESGS